MNTLTQAMQDWMNEMLGRADSSNDVKTKVDADGKYIRTPWELCFEILGNIKQSVTDLSNKKILVVDTVEFIPVLLAFGVNKCNIVFVAPYEFKGKIASSLGVTVVQESLLTWKPNMKFDVVVGNPPYQDGKNKLLYRSFVTKSFDLSTHIVAMVTPASWNSAGMTPFKRTVINNGLVYYNYLGTKTFTESQNDVCAFVCNKTDVTRELRVKNENEEQLILGVADHGVIPHRTMKAAPILVKLSNFTGMDTEYVRGVLNPEKFSCGNEKFIVRNGYSGQPAEELSVDSKSSIGKGNHKVVVAYNSSIGNIGPAKYVDPSYSIGYAVACFQFSTINECDNFVAYINSKIVKFTVKNLKTSIQNAKNTFEKIPKLDLTRRWTDYELYAHIGLTQEEINYIEETIT